MATDDTARLGSDPRHFERLVDMHGPRVHAYLARRAPGRADDLLAEVWLAACAARHRYDPSRGDAAGWLFGIARNVLLASLRRDTRRSAGGLPAEPAAWDEWAAVDARLDAGTAARRLRSTLASMPAEEREVLLLIAWEELTPSEAAEALGIPPGTARSRLHRARARLIAELSPDPPAEPPRTTDQTEREAIR